MSKNLTRKGLAFGALVALGASLIAGAPAQAIENNVSLAPTTGTEYTVLKGQSFSLSANFSNAAKQSGTYLKFLVADASEKITAVTGNYSLTPSAVATGGTDNAVVTLTVPSGNLVKVGDKIDVATTGVTSAVGIDGTNISVTGVSDTTIVYSRLNALTTDLDDSSGVAGTVSVSATTNRATNKSFVIDTKTATNTAATTVTITAGTADATTQSAIVTAWVDTNDNGKIDVDTEYSSPARTVKFINPADLAVTTTIAPVSAGTENLVAYITTEPVLNGEQVGVQNVGAAFTRQDSTATVAAIARSWSDTTKTWTAQVSLSTTAVASENTSSNNMYGAVTEPAWTGLTRPSGLNVTHASSKVASKVLTITSASAHGLRVGDKVTITGATETVVNAQHTVASIPTTTTFTAALDTADISALTTSGTVAYTVTTYSSNNGIVDRGFPGTYTATAAFNPYNHLTANDAAAADDQSQYLVKAGTAATNSASAKTAAKVAVDVVASATAGRTGTGTADVLKGATEATVVATVTNSDKASVGAGVQVSATVAETAVGTPTVNGSTNSVVYATTDANGQAKFVVKNASALAGETVTLTFASEGVAGDNTEVLTWAAAKYTIVDLADAQSAANGVRSRSANGSYTFNLAVLDQFKVAAGADIRLVQTLANQTQGVSVVTLSSGKASVKVADDALTTDGYTTVSYVIQKKSAAGVWATVTDATATHWDADGGSAYTSEIAPVVINWTTATSTFAMNADAAQSPNTTTAADLAAKVSTTAGAAADLRTSAANAPYFADTDFAATIAGVVKNASTGAGLAGRELTATATGVLFNVGDVWSVGSISFVAGANGHFNVKAYSINSGEKTITIANGAVTTTVKATFTGASTDKKVLTISGAQKVSAGSTLQANILLVDGNGNAVDTTAPATTPAASYIKVSYDGPGLVSGALPTETDSDGKASVRYLLGTQDKGAATVTVKYDQNYDGDFVDANDIIVVRNYVIGVSAKITKAATSSAVVKNASGATVKIVRGTKSTTKVATSNSQKVTVKGGSGTVKVYVNGVKVASK